jgi:hypothetical protein
MQPSRPVRRTIGAATLLGLLCWAAAAAAQTPVADKPAMTPRPPLLFSEGWKLPPHTGEPTDENMRFTPAAVTNQRLEARLYGADAKVVRAAVHEDRVDLWNGMATSPVAITLRDRRNYVDLTGAARLRLTVRTNAIPPLHPVVKLSDGTLIVSDRAIDTYGEFLTLEIAFSNMRWYGLDPARLIVLTEVKNLPWRPTSQPQPHRKAACRPPCRCTPRRPRDRLSQSGCSRRLQP